MTNLYFIGDTHFGRKYSFLQDYELNISKRNFDVINNCEKIVEDAISNKADHVIFLGDVYDRKIISPTIRKIVRRRIFDPLLKANDFWNKFIDDPIHIIHKILRRPLGRHKILFRYHNRGKIRADAVGV